MGRASRLRSQSWAPGPLRPSRGSGGEQVGVSLSCASPTSNRSNRGGSGFTVQFIMTLMNLHLSAA